MIGPCCSHIRASLLSPNAGIGTEVLRIGWIANNGKGEVSISKLAPNMVLPDTPVQSTVGTRVISGQRDTVIDTMRGVAILMVIAIHALTGGDKAVMTAIDSVFRPCVPIFLFSAGYLSARARSIPVGRRLRRALVPYSIAFGAAYLFAILIGSAIDPGPTDALIRYLLGEMFVYFYIFVYVGCTGLLWLLFAAAGRDGRFRTQNLVILSAAAVVVGLVAGAYLDPLLQRVGASATTVEHARMRDLPFWFGFVAIGVVVGVTQAEDALRRLRYRLATLTVVAYGIYAAVRIVNVGDAADYDSMAFFLYAALFCVTMIGYSFEWPYLAALGSVSYFIYLWHYFIIVAMHKTVAQSTISACFIDFAAALVVTTLLAIAVRRYGTERLVRWLGAA